jgi:hypothetical protein
MKFKVQLVFEKSIFQQITLLKKTRYTLSENVCRRKFYGECMLFDTNSTNFAYTYKNKQLLKCADSCVSLQANVHYHIVFQDKKSLYELTRNG